MPINTAFNSFPQLETERLILRRMHLNDAPALFEILSNEAVTQFYDDDPFTTLSQAQDQIDFWNNGFINQRSLRWGIAHKTDGIIGTCGFYGIHTWHMRAAIGYELAQSHWRQGFMTEALTAILDFGFKKMDLNRIEALVMPENVSSISLLEKLGFENEGLLAQYENWDSKGFVDLFIFRLLRSAM